MLATEQRVKRDSIIVFCALYLVLFVALRSFYVQFVGPVYGYMGFQLAPDGDRYRIALLLAFAWSLVAPRSRDTRGYLVNLLGIFVLLPTLVLYSDGGADPGITRAVCGTVLVATFVSLIPFRPLVLASIRLDWLMRCAFVLTFFLLFMVVWTRGIGSLNFNLLDVYYLRDDATSALSSYSYLLSALSKGLVPLMVVVCAARRQWFLVGITLVVGMLLFAATSQKSMVVGPIVALALFMLMRYFRSLSAVLAGTIALLLVLSVDAQYYLANAHEFAGIASSLLGRRVFFLPTLLNFQYAELFTGAMDNYWWSQSKITLGLVQEPYEIDPPLLVGQEFYTLTTSANAGYFGAGLAQAGIAGAYLYAIGLGLMIAFLNGQGKVISHRIIVPFVLVQIATAFISADLLTLMLTHGMAMSLLLLTLVVVSEEHDDDQIVPARQES